jgi:hypothetical protein
MSKSLNSCLNITNCSTKQCVHIFYTTLNVFQCVDTSHWWFDMRCIAFNVGRRASMYKWDTVRISVGHFSIRRGAVVLRKCTKPWAWCKQRKYICVPSRNGQTWRSKFNLRRPCFLRLPYHLLSKVIEPLLFAGSLFFSRPQSSRYQLNQTQLTSQMDRK